MAKYSTDFSEYATGLPPADWTERFSGSGDWSWTIVAEAGAEGGNILRGSTASSNRILFSWDDIDLDANRADAEVLAKVRPNTTTGRQNAVYVRGSETDFGHGYFAQLDDSGTTLAIREYSTAGIVQLTSTAFSWSADTWYWLRFRVDGTNLYAKAWADGDTEPGSWMLQVTDATLSGAGYVGVGGYNVASALDFDYVAVGTGGDTADEVGATGITEITGTLAQGNDLTIDGTGFGTKSQAAPVLWEDFENGVVGEGIGGNNGWMVYIPEWGGDVPVYANDKVYAGSKAFYKHVKGYDGTTGDFQTLWRNLPAGCDEVYVSMYIYWDTEDGGAPDAGTHKWLRLATGSDGYNGEPQWAAQAQPDGWWYDEARSTSGIYQQYSHQEPKAHRGSWHRIETFYKLDAANGVAQSWVDLTPQQNYSGATRGSGDAAEVTTLMLPGAVANTNKGENYWLDQVFVDNTRARVEIGDAATWSACTVREPQPATVWNDSQIVVTLNQGGLDTLADKWLYIVKDDGTLLNSAGYSLEGYETDFSEYTTGVKPSDWTERWNTANDDWTVVTGGNEGGKTLEHTTIQNNPRLLSWDAPGLLSDGEALALVYNTTSGEGTSVVLRGTWVVTDGIGYESGYVAVLTDWDGVQIRLERAWGGVQATLASVALTSYTQSDWLWIRFQAIDTALKVKVWKAGEAEPAAWTIEVTDTDVDRAMTWAGWVGLGAKDTAGTRLYDYFAVATGTKSARLPGQSIFPDSILSAEAFGEPTVTGSLITVESGIPSAEVFGDFVVEQEGYIYPVSIASEETFGIPAVEGPIFFLAGIPSAEAFDTPKLLHEIIIAAGIPSAEAFEEPWFLTATTEVVICNMAMTLLGAAPISKLTEDTTEARACNRVYDATRDAELRRHPWTFALRRAVLVPEQVAPAFHYTYQYTLPTDFLRLHPDYAYVQQVDWLIEGQKILANEDILYLRYIAQVVDPAFFDELFREVLAIKLAYVLCEPLTQSNTKKQTLAGDYVHAIQEAKAVNAIERPTVQPPRDTWISRR